MTLFNKTKLVELKGDLQGDHVGTAIGDCNAFQAIVFPSDT